LAGNLGVICGRFSLVSQAILVNRGGIACGYADNLGGITRGYAGNLGGIACG
jgi:hypothetical protein